MGATALSGLAACGRKPADAPPPDDDGDATEVVDPKLAQQEGTLQWAVAGNWRNAVDKARDKYQHPIETLQFFEIEAKDTVVDMWPGAGYITEILAPYLAHGKGDYVAAMFESGGAGDQAIAKLDAQFHQHFDANHKLYGDITYSVFGPASGPLVAAGTADCVLMLLVIQDWMAAGIAEKAFADAYAALRPGGVLGIEQHRADIGNVQDPAATNGYVQEPFVRQLAAEAGFSFVAESEINANPKDDKDHPFGVWTLPPQRLTAPRGQPPNPEFDGTLYESIGESDRMTLKFRKPL
ncbi:methyltransferase [Asticcacaulis sp. EMRT-3]|uniref:class I SAM-dependent methyltransferase n=1 Tax=Asticcacaulis sp. EMRT-3 TaxID=3040349 RepID=UPI0024AEBE18|nr:methyltransferase [Asticcacaulis sp. EMRT-3]MDI7773828.1 methyltransferase [Asticcacaulis sp. EMRT-3]